MKAGRRTAYTRELGDKICDVISQTPMGLRRICKENPNFPPASTIRKWALEHAEFGVQYARAKHLQCELMADDTLEIADDGINDTGVDDEGNIIVSRDVIARSRLRVDTRKWLLSKLAPKIYGDSIKQEISGPDGQLIPVINLVVKNATDSD